VDGMFQPTKIVAIGLNYFDHARELNMPIPESPLLFLKPPSSVIGNGEAIIYPALTKELHYEGELAIIVGKKARHVTRDEAQRYIAGYTCANDVTARDLQRSDGQWTRSKSFDTFCPLGPRIAADVDPSGLAITTRVNGQVKQQSNTRNMIFDAFTLLAHVSSVMTLLPGDVIITGTPPGVGALEPGDVVEVEIEGIGILRNTVTKE
jgi:2-keto-4-pentenoate hydratase/2-oxohepta-3-ene-1,7-dioic acid hydratase in catechol pathway